MSQLPIKNCYVERYNVKDGLANSNIDKLYIDSNDILWINTNTNIQIFDGGEFREVNSFESKSQLSSNQNNEIQLINDSSIYKSNEDYTIVRNNKKLAKIESDSCSYVKNYKGNHYLLCNNSQLYLWDSELIAIGKRHNHSLSIEGPSKVITLLQQEDSSIWEYNVESQEIHRQSLPKLSSSITNRALNSAYIHDKYFITGISHLYVFNENGYAEIPYPNYNKTQYHTAICEINDSTAMIGIEQNLYLFNTNSNEWILQYSDINNSEITTTGFITEIVKDNTGHIYINTETEGLIKLYYDSPFDYIGDKNAKSNFVKSLLVDDELNRVLAACLDEGVKVYDKQGALLSKVTKEHMPSKQLRAIGIYPFQKGKYLFYNNADKTLYTLTLNKNNHPIVLPYKELGFNLYYEDYTAINQEKSIILLNRIFEINHDNATLKQVYGNKGTACSDVYGDNLYIGSRDRISIVNLKTKTDQEVILKNTGLVRSLVAENENTVIYGCDRGIYRRNLVDNTTDKLYHKCIYGLIVDSQGVIWASGDDGLVRIAPDGTNTYITQEQGLQGHEFNTNCAALDEQGNLYFGGTNGITTFHHKNVSNHTRLPRIYIKEMIVNDSLAKQMYMGNRSQRIDLNHDENNIQFKLSAVGQKSSVSSYFQYKMQGVHSEWQKGKLTDDHTFHLSPGSYSFDFTAELSDIPSLNTITSIPLAILAPWYKSWWFISSLYLGAIASLVLIFNTIQKRKHLKEKYEWDLKSNLQEERIRISRDLHDNIGSQLTYMVSSLDNIRYKISEDETELISKITTINTFGRQTIEELRNTIWVCRLTKT